MWLDFEREVHEEVGVALLHRRQLARGAQTLPRVLTHHFHHREPRLVEAGRVVPLDQALVQQRRDRLRCRLKGFGSGERESPHEHAEAAERGLLVLTQ